MTESITVFGAGGHAKVVVGLLRECGIPVEACIDDDATRWSTTVLGVPVRGPTESVPHDALAVIAIGKNAIRARLAALPMRWATLVHPRAFVDRSVVVGAGSVIFAGAVVQPDTRIAAHVIVNTGALVDHDGRLDSFAHVAPGVRLAGNVTVEEGAFVGVGASVIPGRTIGAWATVGAGAVVVRDVASRCTVVGVPARPVVRGD